MGRLPTGGFFCLKRKGRFKARPIVQASVNDRNWVYFVEEVGLESDRHPPRTAGERDRHPAQAIAGLDIGCILAILRRF